jgi:hypothetical protein
MECAAADDGIGVNTVHPGVIETPIWTKIAAGTANNEPIDPNEIAEAGVPLRRAGQAQDIANGILSLASDDGCRDRDRRRNDGRSSTALALIAAIYSGGFAVAYLVSYVASTTITDPPHREAVERGARRFKIAAIAFLKRHAMTFEKLTLRSIRARPVMLKLKRPVVARIATLTDWPLILIDLYTEEGVIGRSYLEPYIAKSMRYLIPALHDLGEMLKGRRLAPIEAYEVARRSLHFVGYEGISMIAVAGLDMAAWDALTKAVSVPLGVLLGGSIGAVPAYNSNGLWLRSPSRKWHPRGTRQAAAPQHIRAKSFRIWCPLGQRSGWQCSTGGTLKGQRSVQKNRPPIPNSREEEAWLPQLSHGARS